MNRPLKVLVVEDSPTQQQLMDEMLKTDPDIQVWTACSLYQAKLLIRENSFHVIALDLLLPDCTKLKSLIELRKITTLPIVVVTESSPDLEDDALMEGAQDFLLKGTFNERQLVTSIRHAVIRHEKVMKEVESKFAPAKESMALTEAVEKKAKEIEKRYEAIKSGTD